MSTTEAIRALAVGESFTEMRRVEVKHYNAKSVQAELRKRNNALGVIASRCDGEFVIERAFSLTNSQEHILYGLVVTREK